MILTRLRVGFSWDREDNCSTYSFGSVEGAREWIKSHKEQIDWYAIEQVQYLPCDADNPKGQLYQGMLYHTYVDLREEA